MMGPPFNASYSNPIIASDSNPIISPDDLELYFYSTRTGGLGGRDIYVSPQATRNDPWGPPVNLGPSINTAAMDVAGAMSPDGLILFVISDRPGGVGAIDTWMTRRPYKGGPWSEAVNLGPSFNTLKNDAVRSLSGDGRWAYIDEWGQGNMWMVPIIPIVNFDGDSVVDAADVCIMIDHWGEDYSLCDIGPMPWGDGIIDVEDLKILAEHLFEELFPIELISYWKLDETEGDIAYNSIDDNHGILSGNPVWQPDSGQVKGALEFDGIDDYLSTNFVLDPSLGAFSVLAWIQGGAPGQAIISQIDGPNGSGEIWLGADASDGKLMTGLRPPGQRGPAPPMVSDAVITNNDWHHIGLVWDGWYRRLYVDGVDVAWDNLTVKLTSSDGGLYIGAGKNLETGTFFSGLIDDVRIYNKALTPEEIEALAN
jgi:hypothetical protein